MLNPVEKAIELRKSIGLRRKGVDLAFHKKVYLSSLVLGAIEHVAYSRNIKYEARRQHIISLCAAYEMYWRDFIKQTLATHNNYARAITHLRNHKFSFLDLHKILGQRLTLSELISSCYTFQGTDVINQVCQDVFGIALFREMSETKVSFEEAKPPKHRDPLTIHFDGQQVLQKRKIIDECFTIRHESVHNSGHQFRVSQTKTHAFLECY